MATHDGPKDVTEADRILFLEANTRNALLMPTFDPAENPKEQEILIGRRRANSGSDSSEASFTTAYTHQSLSDSAHNGHVAPDHNPTGSKTTHAQPVTPINIPTPISDPLFPLHSLSCVKGDAPETTPIWTSKGILYYPGTLTNSEIALLHAQHAKREGRITQEWDPDRALREWKDKNEESVGVERRLAGSHGTPVLTSKFTREDLVEELSRIINEK